MQPLEPTLIHQFLERSAECLPAKVALIHSGTRVNYRSLNEEANRLAHWLLKQGMAPGERAVLLLENCREYVVSYYAVLKAGGAVVPLNPELRPETLDAILSQIDPRAVVCSAKSERALAAVNVSSPGLTAVLMVRSRLPATAAPPGAIPFEEALASAAGHNPELTIEEDRLASIIFTSGSTGRPKGVMLSHRNVVSNTRSIVAYLELTPDDIQMVVLPFFYVMGKSLLNTHVAAGGAVVLNNSFAYPVTVLDQMVEEGVTGFSGVPATFAYLLHRSPLRSYRNRLPALRYCSQAGGHLARHIKEELLKVLPEQTKLFVMYGATEAAARLTFVEPARLAEKMDSIGIPIPQVSLKVLGEQGEEVPVGTVGELVADGPNVMLGYWRDPEATAKVLSSHGYHTGDIGYRDADGYFFVVGRRDNQLKVAGHRVDPQEIEDALVATGMVIEAAVLGVADALLGQRLVAVAVAVGEEVTEQKMLLQCSQHLPRHKLPVEIRLVRTLPKNGSGKVDRAACAELFEMNRSDGTRRHFR